MSSTPSLGTLKQLSNGLDTQQRLASTVQKRQLSLGRCNFNQREHDQLELIAAGSWHQLYFVGPMWGLVLAGVDDVQRMCRALESAVKSQHSQQMIAEISITARVMTSLTDSSLAVAGNATPTLLLSALRAGDSKSCAELLLVSDPRSCRFLPTGADQEPCTWFPVVLARGHVATGNAIVEQMRLVYGSAPADITFTQEQMMWMSSIWANGRDMYGERMGADAFLTYVWQTPSLFNKEFPLTMECKFKAQEIADIWDRVHGASSYLHLKEMMAFHDCLACVLKNDMSLMLHQFFLTSFESPAVKITSSGSVVFRTADFVPRVISHFKQFAAEFFGY